MMSCTQRWRPFVLISVLIGLVLGGCAMLDVRTSGQSSTLRWRATDLRQYRALVEEREVYDYTLILEATQGNAMTFTRLQARCQNNLHSRPFEWEKTGQWRIPPQGQLRLPLGTYRTCLKANCRDWGELAPIWRLVLTGTDDQQQPVREVIEIRLPYIPATT